MRATFLLAALFPVVLAACGTRGGLSMPPGEKQPPLLDRWLGPMQPAPAKTPAEASAKPANEPAAGADLTTAPEAAR